MGRSSDARTETEKGMFRQWLKASYVEVAGQYNKDADQRCESEFPGEQRLQQDLDKVLPLTQNSPAQNHYGPVSSVTEGVPVPWPGLASPFAGEASYQDALVSQLETVSMVVKKSNGRGPVNVVNSSRTPVIQTPTPKTCLSLAADHTNYMGSLASEQIRDRTGCTQHDGYSPAVDRVGFSTVAAPLNQLTCKNVRFEWGPEQQQAFDALKSALCHSPVLTTPDPAGQFVTPQGEQVIAYYSRAFSKPERNYCITRRELLTVVESVNHFKHYLCGVKFVVRTDHASLRWLMSFREPEGQLARWIEQLQEYNFFIEHRQGNSHSNADGLSSRPCRLDCSHCSRAEAKDEQARRKQIELCIALRLDDVIDRPRKQQADPELRTVLEWVEANGSPDWSEIAAAGPSLRGLWSQWEGQLLCDGVLWRRWKEPASGGKRWQVVVPKRRQEEVLSFHHGQPGVGHFGVKNTEETDSIGALVGGMWKPFAKVVTLYCPQGPPRPE